MKIVVIGGSGLIGKNLVKMLNDKGIETVAASPSTGVNTITGEGLAQVLAGAQVVVDVTNSPSFEETAVMDFFEKSTRNLLTAEVAAGVAHHVALSVVGIDRPPSNGYFRAKMAQEKLITSSDVPYSIVRATQFFEFMTAVANSSVDGDKVRLTSALVQPIAAVDVASVLADVATNKPLNDLIEIAGPDKLPLNRIVGKVLRANQDDREIIEDDQAPYFGEVINDQSLTPGDGARIGALTIDRWLSQAS